MLDSKKNPRQTAATTTLHRHADPAAAGPVTAVDKTCFCLLPFSLLDSLRLFTVSSGIPALLNGISNSTGY